MIVIPLPSMKQESTSWTSLLTDQVKCSQSSCVNVWFYVRLPDGIIWNRLKIRFWCFQNPLVFFCKSMMLRIWPSSSFVNYILPEYVPLSLNLDQVVFFFTFSSWNCRVLLQKKKKKKKGLITTEVTKVLIYKSQLQCSEIICFMGKVCRSQVTSPQTKFWDFSKLRCARLLNLDFGLALTGMCLL